MLFCKNACGEALGSSQAHKKKRLAAQRSSQQAGARARHQLLSRCRFLDSFRSFFSLCRCALPSLCRRLLASCCWPSPPSAAGWEASAAVCASGVAARRCFLLSRSPAQARSRHHSAPRQQRSTRPPDRSCAPSAGAVCSAAEPLACFPSSAAAASWAAAAPPQPPVSKPDQPGTSGCG